MKKEEKQVKATVKRGVKKSPAKRVAKRVTKRENALELKVYDVSGQEKETLTLPKEIFAVDAKPSLLAQYIRVYLANQRQGTASTKTRGEVTGSTRKIYRQKGTGRARHGDIKAPIFVGGGIVGGPKPTNYSLKINKKQKKLALRAALTLKNKEANIIGLTDAFLKIEPKTKIFANFLKNIKSTDQKILLILPKLEKNNLVLAARNIQGLKLEDAVSINPYEILKSNKILVLEKALEVIENNLAKS